VGPFSSSQLTVVDLAQRVGKSDRQIRAAVHALERRGLVVLEKRSGGFKGEGQYGRLLPKFAGWTEELPTA
jgi:hypothetical protein